MNFLPVVTESPKYLAINAAPSSSLLREPMLLHHLAVETPLRDGCSRDFDSTNGCYGALNSNSGLWSLSKYLDNDHYPKIPVIYSATSA